MGSSAVTPVLVEIVNEPRAYAWGSQTLLAQLQRRPATGLPEAEVWFGDHPTSPSRTVDGMSLLDLVRHPLPFLVKLLAASSPLSIQVHPSKRQAADGYARERSIGHPSSRSYSDENHKPELLIAVSDRFTALAGLRDLESTRRLVAVLGPAAESLSARLVGDDGGAVLRDAIGWLLSGEAPIPSLIDAVRAAADEEFDAELGCVRSIANQYPGDAGVMVALLMNVTTLRAGEALFVPAGMLHAYVEGLGVEVMAVSDNVVRGGLTSKHVDVPELLSILDPSPGPPEVMQPVPSSSPGSPRVETFAPDVPDFRVHRVFSVESATVEISPSGPVIAVVGDGAVEIGGRDTAIRLTRGRACYASGDQLLTFRGRAVVYVAEQNPG